MVDATSLSAMNAYRNQLKLAENAAQGIPQEETNKPSFSSLLEDAATSTIDNQYQTEALKMDSLTGKVELSELVTAVTNAELTLNTVVAVRDRVISAYQDIMRMPI